MLNWVAESKKDKIKRQHNIFFQRNGHLLPILKTVLINSGKQNWMYISFYKITT
jgi:hypothetical protein